jgi:hypothetical protein
MYAGNLTAGSRKREDKLFGGYRLPGGTIKREKGTGKQSAPVEAHVQLGHHL